MLPPSLEGQVSVTWTLGRPRTVPLLFLEDCQSQLFYSPGHEAAFAAFLCCLCKIGVLRVDDQIAIVFKVFNR